MHIAPRCARTLFKIKSVQPTFAKIIFSKIWWSPRIWAKMDMHIHPVLDNTMKNYLGNQTYAASQWPRASEPAIHRGRPENNFFITNHQDESHRLAEADFCEARYKNLQSGPLISDDDVIDDVIQRSRALSSRGTRACGRHVAFLWRQGRGS